MAAEFHEDLLLRFVNGPIVQSHLFMDASLPIDLGDQAIWHGYATAMEAIGGSSVFLSCFVDGLVLHQPKGILVRGVDPVTWRMQWDASNDSATGHLVGLFFVLMYGEASQRMTCVALVKEWASAVVLNNYSLVNADMTPTTYGVLEDGWKTDPLRITLLMALLLTAYTFTGVEEYCDHYDKLRDLYEPLTHALPFRCFGLEKYPDLHRGAMHLYILSKLDADNAPYLKGLRNYQKWARKEGNILVLALCAGTLGSTAEDGALARKVLGEFSILAKNSNPGKQLSLSWPTKARWGGEWVSRQPIPKWQKRTQDYEWARNPYALDSGVEGQPADSYMNGSDFLFAYYLCKLGGLL